MESTGHPACGTNGSVEVAGREAGRAAEMVMTEIVSLGQKHAL